MDILRRKCTKGTLNDDLLQGCVVVHQYFEKRHPIRPEKKCRAEGRALEVIDWLRIESHG